MTLIPHNVANIDWPNLKIKAEQKYFNVNP